MPKTEADAPAVAPAPASGANDSSPVGTPPGGGSWTWDAAVQAWAELNNTPQE